MGLFDVDGIVDLGFHDSPYVDKVIDKIKNGPHNGLQTEKLRSKNSKNVPLFTVRLNGKARLLFTIRKINGKRRLVYLYNIGDHKHNQCKFINSDSQEAAFRKTFANMDIDVDELIREAKIANNFERLSPEEQEELFDIGLDWERAYHFDKPLNLTNDQGEILHSREPNFAILGAAGGGKTSTAFLYLIQMAYHYLEAIQNGQCTYNEGDCLYYVTKSKDLADKTLEIFKNHPSYADIGHLIKVVCYEELTRERNKADLARLDEFTVVGMDKFGEWFKFHMDSNNSQVRINEDKPGNITVEEFNQLKDNKDSVYQEFRIISGFDGFEDYLKYACTEEYSNYSKKPSVQAFLFKAYACYLDYLLKNEQINFDFYQWQNKDAIAGLLVDEFLDLTLRQIRNLHERTQAKRCQDDPNKIMRNIVYAGGDHQNIYSKISNVPFVLNLVEKFFILTRSFRCPEIVTKLINLVIRGEYAVTNGLSHKNEQTEVHSHADTPPGMVRIFEEPTEQEWGQLRRETQSADFVVLTHPEFIEEAKKKFNTPLVFDVKMIKGLQYPHVIIYLPFANQGLEEIDPLFAPGSEALAEREIHRAKQGQWDPKFATYFHWLHVGISRTASSVTFIGPKTKKLSNLWNYFFGFFAQMKKQDISAKEDKELFLKKWTEEFEKFYNLYKLNPSEPSYLLSCQTIYNERLASSGHSYEYYIQAIEAKHQPVQTPIKLSKSKKKRNKNKEKKKQINAIKAASENLSRKPVKEDESTAKIAHKKEQNESIATNLEQLREKANALSRNFTSPELKNLLQTCSKKELFDILFTTPLPRCRLRKKECFLIEEILVNTKKSTIFIDFLENNKQAYQLFTSETLSKKHLTEILDANSQQKKVRINLLYWFCTSENGLNLLEKIFANNENVIQPNPEFESLFFKHEISKEKSHRLLLNDSLFYVIIDSSNNKWLTLLPRLLKLLPEPLTIIDLDGSNLLHSCAHLSNYTLFKAIVDSGLVGSAIHAQDNLGRTVMDICRQLLDRERKGHTCAINADNLNKILDLCAKIQEELIKKDPNNPAYLLQQFSFDNLSYYFFGKEDVDNVTLEQTMLHKKILTSLFESNIEIVKHIRSNFIYQVLQNENKTNVLLQFIEKYPEIFTALAEINWGSNTDPMKFSLIEKLMFPKYGIRFIHYLFFAHPEREKFIGKIRQWLSIIINPDCLKAGTWGSFQSNALFNAIIGKNFDNRYRVLRKEVFITLLANGWAPNMILTDKNNENLLHFFIRLNRIDLVEVVLENATKIHLLPALLSQKNGDGDTPMSLLKKLLHHYEEAVEKENDSEKILEYSNIVQHLMQIEQIIEDVQADFYSRMKPTFFKTAQNNRNNVKEYSQNPGKAM